MTNTHKSSALIRADADALKIIGYTFSIEGTQIHLEFDPNCQLKS